jgi:hypothetical protein
MLCCHRQRAAMSVAHCSVAWRSQEQMYGIDEWMAGLTVLTVLPVLTTPSMIEGVENSGARTKRWAARRRPHD